MNELLPVKILNQFSNRYPGCWRTLKGSGLERAMICQNGQTGVFVPVAGSYAVVSGGGMNRVPLEHLPDVALMHNLAAWRLSQGIYRFDPDIYREITETSIKGELPVDLFLHLPEWGIYIELQDDGPAGVFVALEQDQNDGHTELRLVFANEDQTTFFLPVHLYQESLESCLVRTMEYTAQQVTAAKVNLNHISPDRVPAFPSSLLPHTLSLVLYICSARADLQDGQGERPGPVHPTKTKKGQRYFPSKKPRIFEAGYRLGEFIRRQRTTSAPAGGTQASPSPHVRAAHWHTYWTGPRSEPGKQKRVVKWLPPIPVGFKWSELEDQIVPVVRKVKKR